MYHRDELIGIRDKLNEQLEIMERELSILPPGYLVVTTRNGKRYCYQHVPRSGNKKKDHRYGISNDPQMINALVRKRYLSQAIANIKRDIEAVTEAIEKYRDVDENTVMREFVKKYPDLEGAIYRGALTPEDWAANYAMPQELYPQDRKQTHADGTPMRSKGELYISSRLDVYKMKYPTLVYRFECPINHPDIRRVPDFTIKRPRDGKIIYWEHFGKVSDDDYMRDNDIKLYEYSDYGIVPWDNLIITYDKPDGGIDGKIIDAMIEGWLI